MNEIENSLWCEKWRPSTIAECVLPESLKKKFQSFVDKGVFPNLILSGSSGTGKTTIAKALCNELQYDCMVINASLDRGIDILRNEITNFVTKVSFTSGKKAVILDEADRLTGNVQDALKSFTEEFSKYCVFILTSNHKNKIIAPLHGRCSVIDFHFTNEEKKNLAKNFFVRCKTILQSENVEYDEKVLLTYIVKHIPNNRKILNELQSYASAGKIDEGILGTFRNGSIKNLAKCLQDKNFNDCRKWISENSDLDMNYIFRSIFEEIVPSMEIASQAACILIVAEYQYKHNHVADPEINMLACFVEIMQQCY
jgi:DNA polymerase III delta prime subunit